MRRVFKISAIVLLLGILVFLAYFNNTSLVNRRAAGFYTRLKDTLVQLGYDDRLLVISTKRFKWHNDLQVKTAGAATKSRHLTGEAIDFIVFDINKDGTSDSLDVNIVFELLDKSIVRADGGLGTYKHEHSFIDRQMIHLDCRGFKARWNR
jgi:uncharacterized protein YcbK (DUF882 family)